MYTPKHYLSTIYLSYIETDKVKKPQKNHTPKTKQNKQNQCYLK